MFKRSNFHDTKIQRNTKMLINPSPFFENSEKINKVELIGLQIVTAISLIKWDEKKSIFKN